MKKILFAAAFLPMTAIAAPKEAQKLFKAEQVVVFTVPAPVCTTREGLAKYVAHLLRGEETKAKAMEIDPRTGNGQCFVIPAGKKVKILSVNYEDPDIPDLGVMEIVGYGNKSANGAFAFTGGAVPAK